MSLTSSVLTVVTTALASGSIAAVVTHFLTSDRERRSLRRQKAEDLYVSVEAWENSWGLSLVSLQGVVMGNIDYNQHLDMVIEQGKKADGSLNRRVYMLTEIYFPSAEVQLRDALSKLDEYNRLVAIHKAAYKDGEFDVFDWGEDFAPKVAAVTAAFASYRKAVVRCAQSSFKPLRLQ